MNAMNPNVCVLAIVCWGSQAHSIYDANADKGVSDERQVQN